MSVKLPRISALNKVKTSHNILFPHFYGFFYSLKFFQFTFVGNRIYSLRMNGKSYSPMKSERALVRSHKYTKTV